MIDLTRLEPIIKQYAPQAEEVLKTAIINLVQEEIQNKSILSKLKNIIKKGITTIMTNFKFNLQNHSEDTTTATTVIADAATDAAKTTIDTAAQQVLDTNNSTSVISDLILKANQKIADLEAEEAGTSKSWYVKDIRDPFEVIAIKALVVAATTGSAVALANLAKKLK